ncbi:hypothetical protein HMI55_004665 [Coelomomyces lativittatus]|nr:hypothetical protein HMI56_005141 [Coelomomyces lativittatus]KAJ1498940.1 hypothetical protein HMI55_004665 [Coelomomyces lativittatus]
MELLESKLGPKQFGIIYSGVRASTLNIKQARKQEMSELAVSQPGLHARRLLLKKDAKKRLRKRKIAEEIARKPSFTVKRARPNPLE